MPLELPRDLVLNAFEVLCPGDHRLTRVTVSGKEERRSLSERYGLRLYGDPPYAYASGQVALPRGQTLQLSCDEDRQLHVWDVKEALAAHCVSSGLRAHFGRAGELVVVGFPDIASVSGIRVLPRLRVRLDEDGIAPSRMLLTARRDVATWLEGSLADLADGRAALGERATRLRGDGPDSGEVLRFEGDMVVLRVGETERVERSTEFTLVASPGYIFRHRGPDTFRKLQIASGSLSSNGQRNRYAVKDRFSGVAKCLASIGWEFPLSAGAPVKISEEWTEIRVQGVQAH
jgi:hypothetical protein